jgi:hypothetical protein
MKTKQKQLKFVLDHLESGETLTSVKAQCIYSIHRLASRISDLRKAGHNIESIKIGGGFVKYRLDDSAPMENELFKFLQDNAVLDEYIEKNKQHNLKGLFELKGEPRSYLTLLILWGAGDLWERLAFEWWAICDIETLKANV